MHNFIYQYHTKRAISSLFLLLEITHSWPIFQHIYYILKIMDYKPNTIAFKDRVSTVNVVVASKRSKNSIVTV